MVKQNEMLKFDGKNIQTLTDSGWPFSGLLTDGGKGKRPPLSKICHTYPTLMKLVTVIPYLKKIKKKENQVEHYLSSADISNFSLKISNFQYIRKYRYRLHFNAYILDLTNFFESSKIVLVNMAEFLMMPAKLATLGLLKIKVFFNKDYDVITPVCDVIKKILSHDSNYIVDVVM